MPTCGIERAELSYPSLFSVLLLHFKADTLEMILAAVFVEHRQSVEFGTAVSSEREFDTALLLLKNFLSSGDHSIQ